MTELLYKDESYLIIGKCMEIHRLLGFGFKEAVYKDALELELQAEGIPFQREKRFSDSWGKVGELRRPRKRWNTRVYHQPQRAWCIDYSPALQKQMGHRSAFQAN